MEIHSMNTFTTMEVGNAVTPQSSSYFDGEDDDNVKIINQHEESNNLPDVMESSRVDSLIAKQMSKLSMDEREKAYFDIHGITNVIEETPQMIEQSIQALDDQLTRLKEATAYDQALSQNPSYVENYSFRLKFLRADRFDAKKAALRLARHFEAKLDLFGPSKLVQDITQQDLQEGDMDGLVCFIGHLPVRDSVGRLVRLTMSQEDDRHMASPEGVLRALFYALCVLSDDEETQRKGCVLVCWAVGYRNNNGENTNETIKKTKFKSAVWALVRLAMTAVPVRHEAIHLCYANFLLAPVFALVKVSLGMYLGVRVRNHYGNKAECLRKLQTFGIPTSVMPLKTSDMVTVRETWKKRKNYEVCPEFKGKKSVTVPGHLDVLLGRGRRCQEHVGNMRLRNLVEDCKPVYDNATRKEKTLISQELVESIKKNANHFLKDEDVGWVEVDDQVARLKVSHTFRDIIKDSLKRAGGDTSGKRLREPELPCGGESKSMRN